MTKPETRVKRVGVTEGGTTLELSAFGGTRTLTTVAHHPGLEEMLLRAVDEAGSIDEAVDRWLAEVTEYTPRIPVHAPQARVIVDTTVTPDGDYLVAWGRALAPLLTPQTSTIMICGGVNVDPASDYDTLGSLAAALIRLRLGLFIGVGQRAKPLATQVGLEGSWDGESVWAETPTQAYDYLCDQVRPSDVAVVVGLDQASRDDLFSRWGVVIP
jgi:hypothetical protein